MISFHQEMIFFLSLRTFSVSRKIEIGSSVDKAHRNSLFNGSSVIIYRKRLESSIRDAQLGARNCFAFSQTKK